MQYTHIKLGRSAIEKGGTITDVIANILVYHFKQI